MDSFHSKIKHSATVRCHMLKSPQYNQFWSCNSFFILQQDHARGSNYSNAVTSCHQNQGHLTSTKAKEKRKIIQSFLTTDSPGISVGFSDTIQEGEYILEEDGSVMTPGQLEELFNFLEPSDGGLSRSEDCGMVYVDFWGLNDVSCFKQ
ncbi:hypothetical protein RRG08_031102 [Elysia crispata]|uniref:C-type lectin domain-containing protein n=1 Tax=Elysia crispata TaxID=231223 RepID=A0AAE0ZFM9_9GAST|nr:hypothetical protein RRG08_031102 [Elysia crispata]